MIISLTLNGEIYSVEPEQIYQGANNVNEIFIFAPLSANTSFEMEFTLPNGHITKPYVLERIAPVSSQLNTWKLVVDAPLTQYYGVVKYQFKGTVNGVTTATGKGSFTILQGVNWALPDIPDTNTYELMLNKIAQIEGEVINATSNSDIALETAQEALGKAEQAKTTSEQALQGVQDAITKGNEAINLAQSVNGKAEEALANSQTANANATEALEKAEEAKALASEKSNSKVFDTYNDMVAWLRDANNKNKLAVGTSLYIKDENVPDYWITEVYEKSDVLGFYYGFEELESKLPDISNMVTTDTDQNIYGAKNFSTIMKNGYDLQGHLTDIDFISIKNMTTYANGKAKINGDVFIKTSTDREGSWANGSIEFGIKGSDTIVVEEDEEGNAIQIHLDKTFEDKIDGLENDIADKADKSDISGFQQQIDQANIDINEVRNKANNNANLIGANTELINANAKLINTKAGAIELQNLNAKALKTPLNAPSELKLVGINTNNAQILVDMPKGSILYDKPGQYTDGAMTQKAATDNFLLKSEKPDLTNYLTKNGAETITGTKTFTGKNLQVTTFAGQQPTYLYLDDNNEIFKIDGIAHYMEVGYDGDTPIIRLLDYDIATKDDIPDVSQFITSTVNNLINYYTKTQTYTKDEINSLISNIKSFNAEIVTELPISNISTTTIYLVAKTDTENNDYYDEYLYINNVWEMIGNTKIDLANYYTKDESISFFAKQSDLNTTNANVSQNTTNIANRYTKVEVNNLIKDFITKEVNNLTNYYTSAQIDAKGYLTSVPSNYVTTTELSSKNYATVTYVDGAFTLISDLRTDLTALEETVEGLAGSSDLSERVSTLETNQELINQQVNENYEKILEIDRDYVRTSTWSTLSTNVSTNTSDIASLKATVKNIPTKTSQLTNDSGYVTDTELSTQIADLVQNVNTVLANTVKTTNTAQEIAGTKTFTGAIIVPDISF